MDTKEYRNVVLNRLHRNPVFYLITRLKEHYVDEEKKLKICILSMQRVNNMGSLLQSYALKRILESMEAEVEFIDIKRIEEDFKLLGNYKQCFYGENELSGLRGKLRKLDRYTLNRIHIRKQCDMQDVVFEGFRTKILQLQIKSDSYDLCIIGSDEVFNCLSAGTWGFTSQLFGNIPEAKKVITYAASCGSTTYEELSVAISERIKEAFQNVSGFSARDKNTHDFIARLTDKEIENNLDPVLIYNFDKEIKMVTLPKLPVHYCVIYSYYNRIHTREEINAIEYFCKKNKLIPVAVGTPQFWLKNYIVCTPFQCLKIFQYADFVITDTFHGTIFSAKYAKKFAVLSRDSNKNKLLDLVDKIGMRVHLMNSIEELDIKYGITKNKTDFDKLIEKEEKKSLQYLKSFL